MSIISINIKERAELRSQAHNLKPVVLIGADGLSAAVLKEIDTHLVAHQLIKIRIFADESETRSQLFQIICEQLSAAPIQQIGKLLVIWRPETAKRTFEQAIAPGNQTVPQKTTGTRIVKVIKNANKKTTRRPKVAALQVLGNERVTKGGKVKRQKKRQVSQKRPFQKN